MTLRPTLSSCLALLAWLAAGPALAADAGVAAAVNPDATGTPPDLPTRVIELGMNVVQDERLRTGPDGQMQVLMRDGTTVTMGPSAELTVDRFVYDPEAGTARLVMTQGAGLMRIIGGRASKGDEGIEIRTPSAIVGIRGGIARVAVDAQTGGTTATLVYGKSLTLNVEGTIRTVTRPGLTLSVAGKGQAPSLPVKAPADQVMRANAQLEGIAGRTGGTLRPVADNPAPVRTANASGASAESSFAAVLNSPAVLALGSVKSAGDVTQTLVQNLIQTAASLGTLPACNSCFNFGLEGPLTITGASYATAQPIVDGPGSFFPGFAASFIKGLSLGNVPNLVGRVTYATNVFNPAAFVNSGGQNALSAYSVSVLGGHPASTYGTGAITSINFDAGGGPSSLKNYFLRIVNDVQLVVITSAITNVTYTGGTVVERVGDSVMQAVRTTGGSGTITQTGSIVTNGGSGLPVSTDFTANVQFALNPAQSLHFLVGQPATNIPTAGQFNYNFYAATAPTFADGSGRGVFSAGNLTVNFSFINPSSGARQPSFTLSGAVLMPGDALYNFRVSGAQLLGGQTPSTFTMTGGGGITLTGSSRICATNITCNMTVNGILGGPGANRAGITYRIFSNTDVTLATQNGAIIDPARQIQGAALFRR